MTDTLIARLRAHLASAEPYRLAQRADMPSMLTDESKALLREAADHLERLDAALLHDEKEIARVALVIEAARHGCVDACEIDHHAYHCPIDMALAALDATRVDTVRE